MNHQNQNNPFDEKAEQWDRDPEKIQRASTVAQSMEKCLKLDKVDRALDFGSGTGLLSMALRNKINHIDCLDTSEGMIRVLKSKVRQQDVQNLYPILGDLSHSQVTDQRYDLIFTMLVLHHIDDVEPLLSEFYERLCSPGTLCVIDLFQEDGSFHSSGFQGHHGFNPEDLKKQLAKTGFSGIEYQRILNISRTTEDGTSKNYPLFLLTAKKD